MDQIKIGHFLKSLRKEKALTQDQLAENLGVSSRSVSRWENGATMPDFDLLIELAKTYDVEIGEILNGERTEEKMDKKAEDNLYKIAEYTNDEKERLMKQLHVFAWIGVVAEIIFIGLNLAGVADSGPMEAAASFAGGLAFGVLLVAVIFTSRYMGKIQKFKQRLLNREK